MKPFQVRDLCRERVSGWTISQETRSSHAGVIRSGRCAHAHIYIHAFSMLAKQLTPAAACLIFMRLFGLSGTAAQRLNCALTSPDMSCLLPLCQAKDLKMESPLTRRGREEFSVRGSSYARHASIMMFPCSQVCLWTGSRARWNERTGICLLLAFLRRRGGGGEKEASLREQMVARSEIEIMPMTQPLHSLTHQQLAASTLYSSDLHKVRNRSACLFIPVSVSLMLALSLP